MRVLVVGDSGVGKTTLLRGVCRDAALGKNDPSLAKPHRWTIGCDVHVLTYQSRDNYGVMKDVCIEFVDVGGHPKYSISRAMFYHDVQGIILVHDLSNAKSYDHLRLWMTQIQETQRVKGCVLPASYNQNTTEYPSLNAMPKLVLGNKRDQVSPHTKRPSGLPELRTFDTMEASAEPYAVDTNVFYGFLDKVFLFANRQGDGTGDSGYAHGFSNDGLRQTKARQLSPTIAGGSATGSGSGWWR